MKSSYLMVFLSTLIALHSCGGPSNSVRVAEDYHYGYSLSSGQIAVGGILSLVDNSLTWKDEKAISQRLVQAIKKENRDLTVLSGKEVKRLLGTQDYRAMIDAYQQNGLFTPHWYSVLNNKLKGTQYIIMPVIESHKVSRQSKKVSNGIADTLFLLLIVIYIIALIADKESRKTRLDIPDLSGIEGGPRISTIREMTIRFNLHDLKRRQLVQQDLLRGQAISFEFNKKMRQFPPLSSSRKIFRKVFNDYVYKLSDTLQ